MENVEQDLTKFKLELSQEWRALQTHKWRRPKWVKFPRSMLDDARWIKLSDRARAAWPSILLIASEHPNSKLPGTEFLFRRLRVLGHCQKLNSFATLIDELIQCSFLTKTTPELQSYRVTEIQSPLLRKGDLAVAEEEVVQIKGLGKEAKEPSPSIGQPNHPAFGTSGFVPPPTPASADTKSITYEQAQSLMSGPPAPRFEKIKSRW